MAEAYDEPLGARVVEQVATKPVLCRAGRHHWATVKNADGEPYVRCDRCGKDRGIDLTGATSGVYGMEKQAIEGFVDDRKNKRKH